MTPKNLLEKTLLILSLSIFIVFLGSSCLSDLKEKNLILNNSQYGFRHNRSTLTALVQMTEKIVSSLDAECSTIAIFIDLQKAFDTIDHDILIKNLKILELDVLC